MTSWPCACVPVPDLAIDRQRAGIERDTDVRRLADLTHGIGEAVAQVHAR